MTIHENPPQSTPPGGTFFQGTLPATGRPEPRPPRARFCKKTHPRRKWNSTARPPILFAVPVLFFHTRLAVANHLLPAISTAAASAPRPPANQIHSLGQRHPLGTRPHRAARSAFALRAALAPARFVTSTERSERRNLFRAYFLRSRLRSASARNGPWRAAHPCQQDPARACKCRATLLICAVARHHDSYVQGDSEPLWNSNERGHLWVYYGKSHRPG